MVTPSTILAWRIPWKEQTVAWQATVHRVAKGRTRLEQLSTHSHKQYYICIISRLENILFGLLGLHWCSWAFSSGSMLELLFVPWASHVLASLLAERRLQAHKLQWLQHKGSVVMVCGLLGMQASVAVVWELSSCSVACGIFPDQGSNPAWVGQILFHCTTRDFFSSFVSFLIFYHTQKGLLIEEEFLLDYTLY